MEYQKYKSPSFIKTKIMKRKSLIFLLIGLSFLFLLSCSGNRKTVMIPELLNSVNKMQRSLPDTVGDGQVFTKIEYSDTLLTFYYEIDEDILPFESLIKTKNNLKDFLLTMISASEGENKEVYELCASGNLTIKFQYIGKHSYKEMTSYIYPNDIKWALKANNLPNNVLRARIETDRATCPFKIDDGIIMEDIELLDSMVFVTVSVNEKYYVFNDVKMHVESSREWIKQSLMSKNGMQFIRIIANAHYGLIYHYVGNLSGKTFDVVFSSNDISNMAY